MMTNKTSNENSYLEFTKSIIDKQNETKQKDGHIMLLVLYSLHL